MTREMACRLLERSESDAFVRVCLEEKLRSTGCAHLAAVLHTAGVRRLLTSNPGDFAAFGVLEAVTPEAKLGLT